ncbi:platelet glycoprotein 4 [Clarias gariepinus]
MNRLKCCLIAGSVIGAVMCLIGVILIPLGDYLIESTVKKESVLEEGTTAYENWISAGAPVYRKFFLFDVQNPNDVLNGSNPQLVQKGPYTYSTRYIPKKNVTFYQNNTVSFLLESGAIFERALSIGPEEDVVTTLNLAVAGVYSLLNHSLANIIINLSSSSLFQNRTVKEILWGYHDPMLRTTLGVFYPYNGTYDGPYSVFTGKDDISKVSTIESWQYQQSLSYWKNSYCDMINGTDGSSFAPYVDKKKPLYFFSSDICRSVSAEFHSSVDLKGIEVYHYVLPSQTFAAPVDNPDNQCYCTNKEVTKNCTLAGVLDIKACKGFPVLISLPHFLYSSKDLLENVDGLNPNPDIHYTFLDVEPITGFTLKFAKRLQINMMYGPSKVIKILNKVKEMTIFPIVWLDENAELDDETALRLKKELFSRMDTLKTVQISLISIGAVMFVLSLIGVCVVNCQDRKSFTA